MRAPRPVLAVAAIAIAYVALPVLGLLQRMPWSSMGDLLAREKK